MSSTNPDVTNRNAHGTRSVPATIAEVMTPAPHSIGRDQKLTRAHDMMRQLGLRHLPVLERGQLVGVVSQRDLYFDESVSGVDVQMDTVGEAMTSEVFTAAPGDPVADVVRAMGEHKYGCAVVVDRGHVVGIFTATDACVLLAEVLS